jgi:phosphatidylinositol alpha-1,6-mannosyltransferase
MKSRTVLILTPDFPPAIGGIQLLLHRLVTHLPGWRTHVVTLARENHNGRPTPDGDMQVTRVRGRPYKLGIAELNASGFRVAARTRPDVVVSGHIVTAPAAAAIAQVLKIPFLQYFYAAEVGTRPRLSAFAVRHSALNVAISQYTRRLVENAVGHEPAIEVIPPGVDQVAVAPVGKETRPTIVTVARLEQRYKGFDVMVRAMPLVRARVPDARWVLIGDGPLRAEIAHLIAQLALEGCIELQGAVSDADRDRWLSRSHVFAMPSRLPADGPAGEGFGIVYLEAALHGLPAVGGNVGGAPDAVEHESTGLLVDPTSPVAVAEALATLLEQPDYAARLGTAGRNRAATFTWEAMGARVSAAMDAVVSAR